MSTAQDTIFSFSIQLNWTQTNSAVTDHAVVALRIYTTFPICRVAVEGKHLYDHLTLFIWKIISLVAPRVVHRQDE